METMQKLCIAICLTFLFSIVAYGAQQPKFKRKLTTEIRCAAEDNVNGSYPNVVYTQGEGKNDTLHYIMSTIGIPTILMVRTDVKSAIDIDCDKLMSNATQDIKGAIQFKSKPLYSQTIMFNRLLEYNDTDDVADLSNISSDPALWHVYDLQNLPWKNCSEVSNISHHSITFMVDSDTNNLKFLENGSLSLQIQMFDHDGREDELPHLQFNGNTSQFSLILDGIDTPFTGSRFALEMIIVTSDSPSGSVKKSTSRFIDDEHAPGQFEMIDWMFGDAVQAKGAFLQWKPVSYLKPDRNFKTATKTKDYPLQNSNLTELEHEPSIAYAFYGDSLFNETLSTKSTNVSFGLSKDKFYVLNHYTAWTASMSYGKPPQDTVSALIIIIISVGLGLPVFIIIFGGVGVCIKKSKDKKKEDMTSSYSAVQ